MWFSDRFWMQNIFNSSRKTNRKRAIMCVHGVIKILCQINFECNIFLKAWCKTCQKIPIDQSLETNFKVFYLLFPDNLPEANTQRRPEVMVSYPISAHTWCQTQQYSSLSPWILMTSSVWPHGALPHQQPSQQGSPQRHVTSGELPSVCSSREHNFSSSSSLTRMIRASPDQFYFTMDVFHSAVVWDLV